MYYMSNLISMLCLAVAIGIAFEGTASPILEVVMIWAGIVFSYISSACAVWRFNKLEKRLINLESMEEKNNERDM